MSGRTIAIDVVISNQKIMYLGMMISYNQYLTDTWEPFVTKVREKGIEWE